MNTTGAPLYNPSGNPNSAFTNATAGVLVGSPGSGSSLDLTGVSFTNNGELRGVSGTTVVSMTNLSPAGLLNGGALTTQGGTLAVNAPIVTNNGAITVVTNSITSGGSNALPTLRTNNGALTLSQTVNSTGPLTNTGAVWVKAGTLRPTSYTQTGGSTRVDPGATLKAGSAGTASVSINGGSLTGGGTVQGVLSNAGVVQPGGGGSPLAVTGTFSQAPGGNFGATVTGTTTPGTDFSKLVASGSATLGGTLTIGTSPSFDPAVGTSVRILEASSRSGTFSSVVGIDSLPAGKYWRVVYDATGVSLLVVADPVASIGDVSVTEGNGGTTNATFTVSLDQPSDRSLALDYSTVDETASSPSDYTGSTGTLTFAPGQTSRTVTASVVGDTIFEPDETFLMRLSNPVRAAIGDAEGTGTILNDDPEPPRVSVTSLSPATIGQGGSGVQVTVTGSGFDPTSSVTITRTGITTVAGSQEYVDATTMRVTLNVASNTAVGAVDVTVAGTNGSATCSGCLTITARPTVTSTDPDRLGQGARNREVIVTGTNFSPGAIVSVSGGNAFSTSFVSSTTLEVLVNFGPSSPTGNKTVIVTNPDAGRGTCSACLTLIAGPKVTSVSPSSFARGTTTQVTVTGSDFAPGAKLIGPSGVVFDQVVRVSATTITATASTSATAPRGTNKILTVTNPRSAGYGSVNYSGLAVTS